MSAIGGKDIGGSESDFEALFSMVDGRVEGEPCWQSCLRMAFDGPQA